MSNRLIDKAVAAARIALPLGVAVLVLAPAGAWGAADVIRNSGYSFDRPTYYSDQGELVQYEHSGGSPHNVVSTQSSGGEPLFGSALISSGTTPVNGTELLAPGTYPFAAPSTLGWMPNWSSGLPTRRLKLTRRRRATRRRQRAIRRLKLTRRRRATRRRQRAILPTSPSTRLRSVRSR